MIRGRASSTAMNPLLQETASGRDWRLATEAQRRAFCENACPTHMDEAVLRQSLDTLLRGRTEALAGLRLSDLVEMVVDADRNAER